MTVLEGLSLCVVLMLALYGCAQAAVRAVQWILRPQRPQVSLVLSLCEKEDLEQQIRFAQWLSAEWSIPLQVDVPEPDDEIKHILACLSSEKYG